MSDTHSFRRKNQRLACCCDGGPTLILMQASHEVLEAIGLPFLDAKDIGESHDVGDDRSRSMLGQIGQIEGCSRYHEDVSGVFRSLIRLLVGFS